MRIQIFIKNTNLVFITVLFDNFLKHEHDCRILIL
jgi:hypothetical protein